MTERSPRIAVRRHPERGVYEREAVDAILDEAVFCHVGFVVDGQPFVIPTVHARVDDMLYLHGSPADFERDIELPIWVGVVPLRLSAGRPETAERVPAAVEAPSYARRYRRPADARSVSCASDRVGGGC